MGCDFVIYGSFVRDRTMEVEVVKYVGYKGAVITELKVGNINITLTQSEVQCLESILSTCDQDFALAQSKGHNSSNCKVSCVNAEVEVISG